MATSLQHRGQQHPPTAAFEPVTLDEKSQVYTSFTNFGIFSPRHYMNLEEEDLNSLLKNIFQLLFLSPTFNYLVQNKLPSFSL